MNVFPLSLRRPREPLVLAQCEAFAVMLSVKELEASGLGTEARPTAAMPPKAAPGEALRQGARLLGIG